MISTGPTRLRIWGSAVRIRSGGPFPYLDSIPERLVSVLVPIGAPQCVMSAFGPKQTTNDLGLGTVCPLMTQADIPRALPGLRSSIVSDDPSLIYPYIRLRRALI